MKTCSCGARYDLDAFFALPPPDAGGSQEIPADDGEPGYTLVFRNCTCRSTMCVEVYENGAVVAF